MNRKIILASTSPRRRDLLKKLKIKFKAVENGYKEIIDHNLLPAEVVKILSLGKARWAAKKYPDAIIIAADTVVALKGKILGKPHTAKRAKEMLCSLSGATHHAFTGLTVIDAKSGKIKTLAQKTKIVFRKISAEEIEMYVNTSEPLDRAGAYAIQGGAAKFVRKIEGDYNNVVGLPIDALKKVLKLFGI